MKRVLLTGMSGVGKSTVITALAARGYKAVDADDDRLSEWVAVPRDQPTGLHPGQAWSWRADRIHALLSTADAEVLFLGGCAPNQRTFYPQFDYIVLLTAPPTSSWSGWPRGRPTHTEHAPRKLRACSVFCRPSSRGGGETHTTSSIPVFPSTRWWRRCSGS